MTTGSAQTTEVPLEAAVARAPASGTRSGAVLVAASAASIVANYVFLLAAGRILGSDRYGSLAALLGLLSVVLIPAAAVQMAVSREISRLDAAGRTGESDAFARAVLRLTAIATVPLVAVALALAVPFAHLFHIHSAGVVALAEFSFATTLVFPAAMGVLQGRQRFHALAVLYIFPFTVRLVVLAIVASAGYRLGGAVVATVAGSIAAMAVAIALLGEPLRGGHTVGRPDLRPFLRYLAPVGVGLVAIALLTHVDILIVKARFSAGDAGAYGAASAFARVAFFLPATILAVLFPRTAARQARGEETEDILGRSLLATAFFCALLAIFYLATGPGLVTATFGHGFAIGGKILAPFAIAIGLYSLAQIFLGYHLSRGETRYAWIVAVGVVVQVVALAVVPKTLHTVVWTNVGVAFAMVAAHELFAGSSVGALRAGLRHLHRTWIRVRAVLPETGLVLGGMTAFVCALYWPVVRHLSSTIIGFIGQDSTGSVTYLWAQAHEGGYHVLGVTHHTVTGAPFGWDETNAINLQLVLGYYPTYLVGHLFGYVTAYNLITFAGYVLSGAAMYVLARYLRCSRLVAVWAALVFIVFPYHLAHDQHASLIHLEVLAVLVLALIAAARRPTWLRFALVGVATLACWLMSGYFGPMAMVTAVAFSIGAALTMNRRAGARVVVGCTAFALLATGVMGLGAVASSTNSGIGTGRVAGDLSVFGMRPTDLLVPSTDNVVLGNAFAPFWRAHSHGSPEAQNYLGALTIVLAIVWLVIAVRRWGRLERTTRIATAGCVAAFLAGLLFAAPSPIGIFGHKVWMPSRLLFEVVPAFRVLARWDFLLMTALVPLAALGLEAGRRALARRTGLNALAAVAVVAAMVFSFGELTTHPWKYRFRTEPVPPEYNALSETPNGILAEYPLGYSDIYRLWQMHHGRPIVNGAPPNTLADQARLMLLDPTQPGTAQELSLLGVTAIGIHPHQLVDAEVRPGNMAHVSGYRLVGRYPDGASLYDVVAQASPAFVTLPAGFSPPIRNGSFVGYPFTAADGVGAIDLRARQPETVQLAFDARGSGTHTLRLADASKDVGFTVTASRHVSVLVAIPRGVSRLLIKVDPHPTAGSEISVSVPYTQAASGTPQLNAIAISGSPGF